MNAKYFLCVICACSAAICPPSRAAIYFTEFDSGQNPGSAYYADFTSTHLTVSYVYNSSTGIGKLTAVSSAGFNMAYTSGTGAAGTAGQDDKSFTGSYSLTAYLEDVNNAWQVADGSFGTSALNVYGNLLGGNSSTLLLSANLRTGVNTINDNNNDLEFLFNATGGDPSILKDFFGTFDQGAVILHPGAYAVAYQDLTHSFSNTGLGQADTFVPEPSIYAGAGSFLALMGLISSSRKGRVKNSAI